MTDIEFVRTHRTDDVRRLALRGVPEGLDAQWCMQQIEGWQLATRKLPQWAVTEDLYYPPRLSMEQCSSEASALYKQQLVERLRTEGLSEQDSSESEWTFLDLTGGFGVDFSYMAKGFTRAIYVERQAHLCELASHNLPLLGLPEAEIVCEESEVVLERWSEQEAFSADLSIVMLDPARRAESGQKVVLLEDCSPNVVSLQDSLLRTFRYVIVKLSPMLDIAQARRQLKGVSEVHVVSVQGECKELLLVCSREAKSLTFYCVNLQTADCPFWCTEDELHHTPSLWQQDLGKLVGKMLFEPNSAVLKAGAQDALCASLGLVKLHPHSHLYVGSEPLEGFAGRSFVVEQASRFDKAGLKSLLAGVKRANLTVRNFPATVAELRKRLRLQEGGDAYIFATTLADGSHSLLKCKKMIGK